MNMDKLISLTEGIQTKADKMRILERNGYARADIARFLGVRYQQVRNTLEGDKRTGYNPEIISEHEPLNDGAALRATHLRELEIDGSGFGLLPPDMIAVLDEHESPKLFILPVRGGLFVCTSEGLVDRAAQTF